MPKFDGSYVRKYIRGLPKHDPQMYSVFGEKLSSLLYVDASLPNTLSDFVRELSSIGMLPKKYRQPLLTCLLGSVALGEMRFFSIPSHALKEGSSSLRHKPQYAHGATIAESLYAIAERYDMNISYINILPDIDVAFPLATHESLWKDNCKLLERTSLTPTKRLSILAPGEYEYIETSLPALVDYKQLLDEIEMHTTSLTTLIDFSAPPDFAKAQILSYVITGILLERLYPWGVLLDIQKRLYPFEQPYYQFGRRRSLPIVFCGQNSSAS